MYCPRCGTENDTGNRFCVTCGSELSKSSGTPAEKVPLRRRVGHLIGTDRRTRLITIATITAFVVAIVAFVAIEPGGDGGVTQDAYLAELDRSCAAEKERLAALEVETLRRQPADLREFASVLVTIVAEWRSSLRSSPPPPIHAAAVESLEAAMLKLLIEAGALARVARAGSSPAEIASKAKAVDEDTAEVDRAIKQLGLARCARIDVAPST